LQKQQNLQRRVDDLESYKEQVHSKHMRDIEHINLECQEKKMQVVRLENEVMDLRDGKSVSKQRLDDYENKVKTLIKEFEDESKRHIKEVNSIHS